MAKKAQPKFYKELSKRHKEVFDAVEKLGKVTRAEGPIEGRTAHLIQLAAAAAIRSEGAVHSHARRALKAGATPEEIYHTMILLTSTIGFPHTSAALSWVYDILGEDEE